MQAWLISDTHWGHKNILNFTDSEGNKIRPFDSVEEMNECMYDNWNDVVRKGDVVYHLGDVVFGGYTDFHNDFSKLSGKKFLILGNHDDTNKLSSLFYKILLFKKMDGAGLFLSHMPQHESSLFSCSKNTELLNVHGHIHEKPAPTERHLNISVERTNFSPIPLENVRDYR